MIHLLIQLITCLHTARKNLQSPIITVGFELKKQQTTLMVVIFTRQKG